MGELKPTSAYEVLKPCPFCGGQPRVYGNHEIGFKVLHNCVGDSASFIEFSRNEEGEAITAWNRRSLLESGESAASSEAPEFDAGQPCLLSTMKPGVPVPTMCSRCKNPHHKCDQGAASSAMGDDGILHLWDTHVGEPTEDLPLTDADKLAFARAVLARAASSAPPPVRQINGKPWECAHCGKPILGSLVWGETAGAFHPECKKAPPMTSSSTYVVEAGIVSVASAPLPVEAREPTFLNVNESARLEILYAAMDCMTEASQAPDYRRERTAMTEDETSRFLAQFDKARKDFESWPKWMQDAAYVAVAAFPRAATQVSVTPAQEKE